MAQKGTLRYPRRALCGRDEPKLPVCAWRGTYGGVANSGERVGGGRDDVDEVYAAKLLDCMRIRRRMPSVWVHRESAFPRKQGRFD